jgi:hypothetical protein
VSVCPFLRPPVCLSARNNSTPTGLNFMRFYIWGFFANVLRKFKYHWNLPKITDTLHEDPCSFMIISSWILLTIRNVYRIRGWAEQGSTFLAQGSNIITFFAARSHYVFVCESVCHRNRPRSFCCERSGYSVKLTGWLTEEGKMLPERTMPPSFITPHEAVTKTVISDTHTHTHTHYGLVLCTVFVSMKIHCVEFVRCHLRSSFIGITSSYRVVFSS